MSKKKLLIFHPALAPYRVDQFNAIAKIFDLHIVFIFDNVWNHKFDQSKLQEQLTFNYSFLLVGPRYKGRVFRFGMLKKIRGFNPDIIIGYEYSFTTLYLIALKKLGIIKQKIGSTIDDSLEISRNIQSGMRDRARSYSVKNLDYLIVLSEEVADFYQQKFSLDARKVVVSPLFQNPQRLRKDPANLISIAKEHFSKFKLDHKKVLLFVGRFIPEKGLVKFLDTIAPILKAHPEVIFVIVGDGEEKEKIKSQIQKNALEQSVVLAGRYEGDSLRGWYHCASGFVLPSTYEPFGAVVNEALIFGLPVFCSQYAGSSYLTTPGEDIVFDPNDSQESRIKFDAFLKRLEIKPAVSDALAPVRMRIDFDHAFDGWKASMYD